MRLEAPGSTFFRHSLRIVAEWLYFKLAVGEEHGDSARLDVSLPAHIPLVIVLMLNCNRRRRERAEVFQRVCAKALVIVVSFDRAGGTSIQLSFQNYSLSLSGCGCWMDIVSHSSRTMDQRRTKRSWSCPCSCRLIRGNCLSRRMTARRQNPR